MTRGSVRDVVVLLAAILATGRIATATHPVKEDLETVGKNLQQEKNLLSRLVRKSSSLLQTLSEIDQRLESARDELRAAESILLDLEQQRIDKRQQHREASGRLKKCKKRMAVRIRAMYKAGEIGWLNFLFGADSLSDGYERFEYLQWLVHEDAALIDETEHSQELMLELEQRLVDQQSQGRKQREEVLSRRQQAELARAEQVKAIELVKKEEVLHRKAVAELHRARSRLMKMVSVLEGRDSMSLGFASWQGRLEPPVEGGRIDVPFGLRVDPRFKTKTRQQGVDILVPEGSEVKTVYPGKVAFTKPFHGYGLLVIVDHGGGYYTLYAHLGRFLVKKGDKLRQGQSVGTLGRTGSLKGPYLYFEVREKGTAVDPEKWVSFR